MIEVDLVDRQEIKHDSKWCCYEILTVKCPNCGMATNIVVTYAHGTEYHHDGGKFCQVWTKNIPVPLGFERVANLL
jgi:uncharacterized protein YbbK (DUF523 family)